jgi:glutaminyl-tRNA synthetase
LACETIDRKFGFEPFSQSLPYSAALSWQPKNLMSDTPNAAAAAPLNNFIRHIITQDQQSGKHGGQVVTRFPPEPNGYLHLGHAKSIGLNFGLARDFNGQCNLRFDDTNPSREDIAFVHAIQADVEWLGFHWAQLRHASDYFEVFYRCAIKLIEDGLAFVCDLSAEEVRSYRGTLTEPGKASPFRDRSVAENLALFQAMRAGEFADGAKTLRAKIDMGSGNINLRDPAIYRIRKVPHQNTGDAWCIYPMYDYAHCLSDALEGITHSICTVEFEDHRPLYDWYIDRINLPAHPELFASLIAQGVATNVSRPQQIEFARGNINYTVMSKRKLTQLVDEKLVGGWDDPRMPTISGMRRRGYTAQAIRTFWERSGVSKQNSVIDFSVLEACVREDLDGKALRRMAVLNPLRLMLTNLSPGHSEAVRLPNHPKDESLGERSVALTPDLVIEQDDFMEHPVKGFHRLMPGGEVRLRGIGIIKCDEVIKDAEGHITELRATLDFQTRPGQPEANRKVKGTIHWVSESSCLRAEVRLFERLFSVADPDAAGDYRSSLNANSKQTAAAAYLESAMANAEPESTVQFERLGFFTADRFDHQPECSVFNRTVTLRDSFVVGA